MTYPFRTMDARTERRRALPGRELIGGKAWSVARMQALGLNVASRLRRHDRGLRTLSRPGRRRRRALDERNRTPRRLAGRARPAARFGAGPRPLLVSVRSGAPVSMPGMMDTVLNLGINDETEAALAEECGDPLFARNTHRRFLDLYAHIVLKADSPRRKWRRSGAMAARLSARATASRFRMNRARSCAAPCARCSNPGTRAARGAIASTTTSRTISARPSPCRRWCSAISTRAPEPAFFSRAIPLTGAPAPYGEYLPRAQGEDVVSGKFTPKPLSRARPRSCPRRYAESARRRARRSNARDATSRTSSSPSNAASSIFLQSRAAKLAPHAAARIAVDLVREGLDRRGRGSPADHARSGAHPACSPRIAEGASRRRTALPPAKPPRPASASASSSAIPTRRSGAREQGEAVILARPTTSPDDLHGMIAARAVVTELGGSTSHAAVVGRALGLPCVVGCGKGALDAARRTHRHRRRPGRQSLRRRACDRSARRERPRSRLATLAPGRPRVSPLRVLPPSAPEAAESGGSSQESGRRRSHEDRGGARNASRARAALAAALIASDEGVRGGSCGRSRVHRRRSRLAAPARRHSFAGRATAPPSVMTSDMTDIKPQDIEALLETFEASPGGR